MKRKILAVLLSMALAIGMCPTFAVADEASAGDSRVLGQVDATPDNLTNLKATTAGAHGIKLTWTAVGNADGYKVYKYNYSTERYVLKRTIANPGKTTFAPTGLASGKWHLYKVRPYAIAGNGNVCLGVGMIKGAYTKPAKPAKVINVKATATGTKSFKVTWSKRNCTKHQVRYSRSSSFSGYTTKIAWSNSKKITGLKSGKTYYVKVRAVNVSDSGATAFGKWSATKKVTTKKAAVNNNNSGGGTVYLSQTGSKFHRQSCPTLKYTPTPISRANAIAQGYEACKVCNP